MSDNFDLSRIFNAAVPNMRDYLQHEADRTAHVPPVLDVPVRIVPPPVTIKGDVKFIATFPSDLIYGKRYDEVIQMILTAFETAGLESNPLLPELRIHNLQAWREEIGRPDQDRTTSGTTVPTTGGPVHVAGPAERGDALVAAAEDALAGLREDVPSGGEEHPADSYERGTDDSIE